MSQKKPEYPSDKQDQYMVRFPDGLRDRIKRDAKINRRSMNAEIVATLIEAYPPETEGVAALMEFIISTIQPGEEDGKLIQTKEELEEFKTRLEKLLKENL